MSKPITRYPSASSPSAQPPSPQYRSIAKGLHAGNSLTLTWALVSCRPLSDSNTKDEAPKARGDHHKPAVVGMIEDAIHHLDPPSARSAARCILNWSHGASINSSFLSS